MKDIMKPKFKSIKLSIYFTVLLSIIIIATTTLFTVYSIFSIKNLVSEYESDAYKLRYSLSTILVNSLILDIKKQNFEATENLIDILKKDNLLSYTYVKDNSTNKIILGESEVNYENAKTTADIQQLSKTIDNYTVYFGIPSTNNNAAYYSSFIEMIANISTN